MSVQSPPGEKAKKKKRGYISTYNYIILEKGEKKSQIFRSGQVSLGKGRGEGEPKGRWEWWWGRTTEEIDSLLLLLLQVKGKMMGGVHRGGKKSR